MHWFFDGWGRKRRNRKEEKAKLLCMLLFNKEIWGIPFGWCYKVTKSDHKLARVAAFKLKLIYEMEWYVCHDWLQC